MTSVELSTRVNQVKPSATIAVNAKATELLAEGKDIINLSVGEPDFDTPDYIKQAAIDAINAGFTKYTAVDGIASLKEAIIEKLINDNQLYYKPNEIIVSNGAKQVLYNLCQSVLNDGDEVIIPAPYWVSYPDMTLLAGAKPIIVSTDIKQNFKITAEQLEKAITPKTRIFMLNSPSNPSGMTYTAAELKALGKVLKKYPRVIIASDDIYEYILWGMDKYVSILNVCPELKDQTIVVNGVSKSYAMTGWRIGYAAGPEPIIKAMKKIQSQSTSGPNSIAQKAAIAALKGDKSLIAPMVQTFKERHDLMFNALKSMSDVEVLPADGAFYLFANVKRAIDRLGLKDDVELAEMLLVKANVAIVPGTAFGAPYYIRISCANSVENLQKAIERMRSVLDV